jgi:hypothetical protein
MGATTHFGIFALVLKQQREDFGFAGWNRHQHGLGAD